MGLELDVESNNVVLRGICDLKEALMYLQDLLGIHYIFLEFVNSHCWVVRSFMFRSHGKLVFLNADFLVPFLESEEITAASCAMFRHSCKLAESDAALLPKDLEIGQNLLAIVNHVLISAAREHSTEFPAPEMGLRQLLRWLYVADEIVESLISRHGGNVPDLEEKLHSRQADFMKTMRACGISKDYVPPQLNLIFGLAKATYDEALSQLNPIVTYS